MDVLYVDVHLVFHFRTVYMHRGRVNNSVSATIHTAPIQRAVSLKLLVAGENWSQIWICREKVLQVQTNALQFYACCRKIFKVSRAMS